MACLVLLVLFSCDRSSRSFAPWFVVLLLLVLLLLKVLLASLAQEHHGSGNVDTIDSPTIIVASLVCL